MPGLPISQNPACEQREHHAKFSTARSAARPAPGRPSGRTPSISAIGIPAILLLLAAPPAGARNPDLSRYPLRIHVLASDQTHKTPRMSPGEAVACDGIEGMLDSVSPNPDGPISISGVSRDPCSLGAAIVQGGLLDMPDEDPIFSGEGRGDLVSPPAGTQGFSFRYDNCVRIRVHPGFQSFPARWKRPGQTLEVLIPSDDIPVSGRLFRR
jgi:hypothetical protein